MLVPVNKKNFLYEILTFIYVYALLLYCNKNRDPDYFLPESRRQAGLVCCISLNKTTVTTYISGFVYQNDTLQFISHEEGRIRPQLIVPATGYTPANINWVYDYFEKDHLGNVRTVLIEETNAASIFV